MAANNDRGRPSDPLMKPVGQSRARNMKRAVRVRIPARIMISGQPSAGKTQSSLDIAQALIDAYRERLPDVREGRIVMIDTEVANGDGEAGTSQNFADGREFDVIPFTAPYHPLDLVATLTELARTAAESDVVIIDSGTAFWHGEQGILDLVGHNATKSTFNRWNPARKVQTELYDRIKSMPCHVIVACRAKEKNLRTEETDGSVTITNVGLVPMQDGDFPYEMTLSGMLDRETHALTIDKCNAPIPLLGRTFPADKHHEVVDILADWLAQGGDLISPAMVAEITALFDTVPETDARGGHPRADLKRLFLAEWRGAPATLRADQGDAALEWLQAHTTTTATTAANADTPAPAPAPAHTPAPVRAAAGSPEVFHRGEYDLIEMGDPGGGDPVFRAVHPSGTSAVGTTVQEAIELCEQKRAATQPDPEPVPVPAGGDNDTLDLDLT